MLFTTLAYGAFFIVVFAVHWVLPRPLRRLWLLVASYYFYLQALPIYGFLIAGMTAGNYLLGWAIWHTRGKVRRAMLATAIIANLLTLGYFKYTNLLLLSVSSGLRLLPRLKPDAVTLNIVLPLGISFFTFEFIHYAVEVYRGHAPIKHPVDFALFAAFFPTQIAGPIKRFPDWVKQLHQPVRLGDVQAHVALRLILRGMVKKIVVADMLAPLVTAGFAHPERLGFAASWLVIYAFAAQIYADFSGYTDIGRGCAMLLGYAVPENFNSPYQARNPSEFWERWHISLSRWLRDYLFIPLGGSRVATARLYFNLLVTMALGGLWHGASWHFMLWGVYQGALLIGHRLWGNALAAAPLGLRRWTATRHGILVGQIATFHLVCLGWLFFRADTLGVVTTLLRAALTLGVGHMRGGLAALTTPALSLAVAVLVVTGLIVSGGWLATWVSTGAPHASGQFAATLASLWRRYEIVALPLVYLAMLMLIVIWPASATQRFIYFQF